MWQICTVRMAAVPASSSDRNNHREGVERCGQFSGRWRWPPVPRSCWLPGRAA
uniref:Uncharacterized protein n=1 Tax=Nonomuraea gerenzanensis TaxID=93944 RepID=A0A1M4EB63_9ACTN|nr:hypothetical protein BN4615_P5665 [Nonomuraea gerenzanensis]